MYFYQLLLPSGDISAVGDFSNVPNIMASSKPATGRKKDNYDDPGLPSPDDSLPLRDWLKGESLILGQHIEALKRIRDAEFATIITDATLITGRLSKK